MHSQIKYLAISIIMLAGCKAQQAGSSEAKDDVTTSINKKLGAFADRQNNFNNTYVLAWTKLDKSAQPLLRYGVWNIKSAELVLAGTAVDGKVEWLDNTTLIVEDYDGIRDDNTLPNRYKIDIKTQVRIPITEQSGNE